MIRINKYNEVYSQLDTDTYTKGKLVRLFRIQEPNYYFNPRYKAGLWDGRRQLYNGGNYIYNGLVPMVIKWAAKNNVEVQDNTDIFNNSVVDLEKFKANFIDKLKLPFEPRDYQVESVAKCIEYKKCAVSSPTSSGKSLIIYMLTRFAQEAKTKLAKIVIIVPSKILVKQMYDDFANYSKNDETWNVEDNCARISGDFIKDFSKDIIITTYQSLINVDPEFFKKIGVLFLDECHGAQSYNTDKAKRLHTILNQCINSRYRFGFTGTFPDEMLFRTTLLKYFVNKYEATDYSELLENNWISNFNINVIKLHHLVNKNGQQYRDELNYIYEDKKRNEFLKKLLLKNKKNQLVLFKEVKQHAKKFYDDLVNDPRFKGKHIIILDGDSKVKERDKVKEYIRDENDVILLATYKLLGTGWSVNNLHHIIFAAPLKSKQTILQSIGRGLRLLSNGDKNCQIWDIVDKFLYNNTLYVQWKERQRAYESVKFNMKIFDIDDTVKKDIYMENDLF
ncbi:DEAD/DEAH box helicase family protein [bacterium]|nr:DEAD/DEAH box helicase family protein [bacterium]